MGNSQLIRYCCWFDSPEDEQNLATLESSQELNLSILSAFIDKIKQNIFANKNIYGRFFPTDEIINIIETINLRYVDNRSALDIIRLVIDFLSYCKNAYGYEPTLPTTFTQNYPLQLAKRWKIISESNYSFNKSHLRLLGFIVPSPSSGRRHYNIYLQQIQKNLQKENWMKVAAVAKSMARQNQGSFCYLSYYLYISCLKLNESGMSVENVKIKCQKAIAALSEIYQPVPKAQGPDSLLDQHKSIQYKDRIPNNEIDLKNYTNRQQAINNFIMEHAQKAMDQRRRFIDFFKQICYQNGGFCFKEGLKIKQKSQLQALLRIKQKLLEKEYLKAKKKAMMRQTFIKIIKGQTIQEQISQEKENHEKLMKQTIGEINKPIVFTVRDMLRGKCMFSSVQQINKCCSSIIQALTEENNTNLKLIEISNRLKGHTSDLVVRILFDGLITEMQLVINHIAAENEFNHKLYQLKRSKFFSPLAQLSILNEKMCQQYFAEAMAVTKANVNKKNHDYNEAVTFSEAFGHLQQFIKDLPFKVHTCGRDSEKMDLSMINNFVKQFLSHNGFRKRTVQLIKKYRISFSEGIFHLQLDQKESASKYFSQALKELQKDELDNSGSDKTRLQIKSKILAYLGQLQTNNSMNYYKRSLEIQKQIYDKINKAEVNTIKMMGNSYLLAGPSDKYNYYIAKEFFQQCLKIENQMGDKALVGRAQTFQMFGRVYYLLGYYQEQNYTIALNYFEKSLQIFENISEKDVTKITSVLNNIGNTYYKKGQCNQAIKYHFRSLEMKQKNTGKGRLDIASSYNNIGLIYYHQAKHSKALQQFERALDIIQTIRGKYRNNSTTVKKNMANAHYSLSNYDQALKLYQEVLQMEEYAFKKDNIISIDLPRDGERLLQAGFVSAIN